MLSLFRLIDVILDIIWWVILAQVIASWLVAFGVINTRNRGVYTILDYLNRLTEPILRPIRNILPNMGGLDLSPLVLFLLISFLQSLLHEYAYPAAMGAM